MKVLITARINAITRRSLIMGDTNDKTDSLVPEGYETLGQLIGARRRSIEIADNIIAKCAEAQDGLEKSDINECRRILLDPKIHNPQAAQQVCAILIQDFLDEKGYKVDLLGSTSAQRVAFEIRKLFCSQTEIELRRKQALQIATTSDFTFYLKSCRDTYEFGESPIDYINRWLNWGHSFEECYLLLKIVFSEDETLQIHLKERVTNWNSLRMHVREWNSDLFDVPAINDSDRPIASRKINTEHPHFPHFLERLVFLRYEKGLDSIQVSELITEEYANELFFPDNWNISFRSVDEYLAYADSEYDKYLKRKAAAIANARTAAEKTQRSVRGTGRVLTAQEQHASEEAEIAIKFFQALVDGLSFEDKENFLKMFDDIEYREFSDLVNNNSSDDLILMYRNLPPSTSLREKALIFKAITKSYILHATDDGNDGVWIKKETRHRTFYGIIRRFIETDVLVLGGTDRLSRQRSYQARQVPYQLRLERAEQNRPPKEEM